MEPMTGMLARDGGTGAMNAIDLRDPRVQMVVKQLQDARIPVTRERVLEGLASMPSMPVAAPQPAAPMMPVRGGPSRSFADPYEAQLAQRRAEQEAEFRAAQAAARAKRQPGMITGR